MRTLLKKYIPKDNTKVKLFIVGAQKAGTTALNNYLIKHPKIIGGYKKEIGFFNHDKKYAKGISWYHEQHVRPPFYKSNKIYLDSTPGYLANKHAAKRISNYNSNSKIIILLRDPVYRAFSAWNMYKQFSELKQDNKDSLIKYFVDEMNQEKFRNLINKKPFFSFNQFIEKELDSKNKLLNSYPNILKMGLYADHLKLYYKLFGNENILIFESEYFKNNRLKVVNFILDDLGLNHLNIESQKLKLIHSRDYETKINPETEKRLRNFYKPYNEELFKLINKKFDW